MHSYFIQIINILPRPVADESVVLGPDAPHAHRTPNAHTHTLSCWCEDE